MVPPLLLLTFQSALAVPRSNIKGLLTYDSQISPKHHIKFICAPKMGSMEEPTLKAASKYVLKHAKTKEEMDQIMDVIWAANYSPYDPFAQLFFPVLGFRPLDRETSVAESKARFWSQHMADPSSNWFYVVGGDTGNVVGCAQWQIFTSNPFPDGVPPLTAPWWPKGEHRDFCELILNQVYKPRANWMRRPHLGINHPIPLHCSKVDVDSA